MCDAGCEAKFTDKTVIVTHDKRPVLNGTRTTDGLWKFQLPRLKQRIETSLSPQANFSVYDASTKHVLKFLHLCLFSPTKSTLLRAIENNHFVGWPSLTRQNVIRHLELQVPTILGHMDQQRQGTRSTSRKPPQSPENGTTMPTLPESNHLSDDHTKTLHAYLSIQVIPLGRIFTDQSGSFPVVSAQGVKAIMVLYDYDSNAILVEGITSCNQTELLQAYTVLLNRLTIAGFSYNEWTTK